MGSICIKTIGGSKRIFSSCGRMIRPKWMRVNCAEKEYECEPHYNAFEDAEVMDFLKKNKKANYINLVYDWMDVIIATQCVQGCKSLKKYKKCKNCYIVYNELSSTEVANYARGLKSNVMYW